MFRNKSRLVGILGGVFLVGAGAYYLRRDPPAALLGPGARATAIRSSPRSEVECNAENLGVSTTSRRWAPKSPVVLRADAPDSGSSLSRPVRGKSFDWVWDRPAGRHVEDATVLYDLKGVRSATRGKVRCFPGDRGEGIEIFRNGSRTRFVSEFEEARFTIPKACYAAFPVRFRATFFATLENPVVTLNGIELRELSVDRAKRIAHAPPIDAFLDSISYAPGSEIGFYVHSNVEGPVSITLARVGKRGDPDVLRTITGVGRPQTFGALDFRYGPPWEKTTTFRIPENWKSGYYVADFRAASGVSTRFAFIVRPAKASPDRAIVISSTNTWSAYDNWGGGSHYVYDLGACIGSPFSNTVSFRRPNPQPAPKGPSPLEHRFYLEAPLATLFEREGVPYDVISDSDWDIGIPGLATAKAIVISGHPEFWSEAMRDRLASFERDGKRILYLGGNGVYKKVTYDHRAGQMEEHYQGRIHDQDGSAGGYFEDIDQDQAKWLGVKYDSSGGNSLAAFVVEDPMSWVFEGTTVRSKGDRFGTVSVPGSDGRPVEFGASGHETDKISETFSPKGIRLLAKGANRDHGGAQLVYWEPAPGGFVFSVGSIAWNTLLLRDPEVATITLNVIRRGLAP